MAVINSNETLDKIYMLLNQVLKKEIIFTENTGLVNEGLDSMKIIQLISGCEKQFDIEFEDDDLLLEHFQTPKTIYDLLSSNYKVN